MFELNINTKQYPVVFNRTAYRYLGKLWGVDGTVAVAQEIGKKFQGVDAAGTNLTFDQEDAVVALVKAGIYAFNQSVKMPDDDSLFKAFMCADGSAFFDLLLDSMPIDKSAKDLAKKEVEVLGQKKSKNP